MVKYISCDCKSKFNSTSCYLNQKWNNKTCQRGCKIYYTCKSNYSGNPTAFIYENGNYLKRIADNSKLAHCEIVFIIHFVSTNVTNTIPTNVRSTLPTLKKHICMLTI